MTAPSGTHALAIQYELPHPPTKVWRTLTEPELLAQWVMANDLLPVVGHNFTFRMEPSPWWDGIVQCEVLEVEAPRRLRYTWNSGPAATPLNTVVTWTLTPMPNGGTSLLLEQTGFTPGHAYEGAKNGWREKIERQLTAVLTAL